MGTNQPRDGFDLRYFGSEMASSASDFKRRKALAWSTFWKLERCGEVPKLPISTKATCLINTTCVNSHLCLRILGNIIRYGKQNQRLCYPLL